MRRIMIIDNHTLIRETLTDLLNLELDLRVVAGCAEGGPAAGLVERFEPDVVVCDPVLPDLNGATIVRQILGCRPTTRIVLLTAATFGRLADDALAAGAHACLSKALPFTAILRTIREEAGPLPRRPVPRRRPPGNWSGPSAG